MTDDSIQQRVKEIYDAYSQNGHTRDYKITLTPLNGSGDVHVILTKGTKIKHTLTREKIIRGNDSLEFISQH